eukprot:403346225
MNQQNKYSPSSTASNLNPQNQNNRSKSQLGLEKTHSTQGNVLNQSTPHLNLNNQHDSSNLLSPVNPLSMINNQTHLDISKSMDLQHFSPNALIQSCLTFNGEQMDEDINFLSQAMQPDKIFDLPMALHKVQKAFQNSNQNALKLKETLEFVLQREQKVIEKYEKLRKSNQALEVRCEQEAVQQKQSFKEQLMHFTQSVNQLQGQVQERDQALDKLKHQMFQLQRQNSDFKGQIEVSNDQQNIAENQKQLLQNQLQRKLKDFEDLRSQFDQLLAQENQSSKELDQIQKQSKREEQKLKQLLDEKSILLLVQQKETDCAQQEKKIAQDQLEKIMIDLQRVKGSVKEELERKYYDLYEQKKVRDKENDEMRFQLEAKNDVIRQLEKQYQKAKKEQDRLQEQIQCIKKDIFKVNESNREAMILQRETFEKRMHEMEEEVTKVSLDRYKVELEQKQRFLKMTKKYDEQMRDMRHCLGYVFGRIGLQDVPDFLKEDLAASISEAYKHELNMRRGLHNQLQEIKGNIRVLCRVRPLLQHEYKGRKKAQSLKIVNQHRLTVTNEQSTKEQHFQFDRVFEPSIRQNEVSEEISHLVLSSLDGFNVCVMAYGQTGSGKTFTMIGDDDNPGLYFTAVDTLFEVINDRKKLIDYEIGVSIVEIYNETLRDLLTIKGQQPGQLIKLRDNGDGETYSDQVVKKVQSRNQILQCLRDACLNRTVGVTHYNEQSSRSHFVFTLYLTGRHKTSKEVFKGRLNLIDLAGSERILKSQAQGDRIKEALNINQSLTTLGKVFLALLNKASHVPYRDSKLTHYLKDSLGGESKTMLIVQVSPNLNDYGETLSSLNFGQRVSCIEKGQIRATIESPNKPVNPSMIGKRSKSQNKIVEYEIPPYKSVTPQNKSFLGAGYNSFQ